MTKAQALKEMKETSRAVIAPSQAEKWAKAFGTTLKKLGITTGKTKHFHRVRPNSEEDAEKQSVATYEVASRLVEVVAKKEPPKGFFHGMGRNAEWITEGSVKILASL